MTNGGCSNSRLSSMNMLHSNIEESVMRKKQREKENLQIEQENWLRKNEKKRQTNVYSNHEGRKKRQRHQIIAFYETYHRP